MLRNVSVPMFAFESGNCLCAATSSNCLPYSVGFCLSHLIVLIHLQKPGMNPLQGQESFPNGAKIWQTGYIGGISFWSISYRTYVYLLY